MNGPHRLPPGHQNPIAAAIRRAIGVGDDALVAFIAPQFTRPDGWPEPAAAPQGFAEFTNLFKMTRQQLEALGLASFDGGLFLFPAEWYDFIPRRFSDRDDQREDGKLRARQNVARHQIRVAGLRRENWTGNVNRRQLIAIGVGCGRPARPAVLWTAPDFGCMLFEQLQPVES